MKRLKNMLVIALALACGHAAAQDLLWDDVQLLPAYRDRAAYLSCKTRGIVVDYANQNEARCINRGKLVKSDLGPAVWMTLQEVVDVHWPSSPSGKVPVAVGVMPRHVSNSHAYDASRVQVWVAVRYREAGQIAGSSTDKAKPNAQPKTPAALQWRDGLKK